MEIGFLSNFAFLSLTESFLLVNCDWNANKRNSVSSYTCLKMSVNVEKCETATKLFNDTVLRLYELASKGFFQSALESCLERILRRGVRNMLGSSYVSVILRRNDTFYISKEIHDDDKYTWCVCFFQLQRGTQIIPRQYRLTDKLILMSFYK